MEGQARQPLQSLVDIARTVDPVFVPKLISFDPEEPAANYIFISAPGDRDFENGRSVVLNGYTGANQVLEPPEDTLTGFLLKLHVDLFAGFAGQMFVGVMGLLFVVSTVSGLVVYGPFMKKLAFGLLRFRRAPASPTSTCTTCSGSRPWSGLLVVGLTRAILSSRPHHQLLAADRARLHDRPPHRADDRYAGTLDRVARRGLAAFRIWNWPSSLFPATSIRATAISA